MLPPPALTLTLPSLHDATVLDVRVFHPYSLTPSLKAPAWQRHAAVVAHPYAPLGGSYDDPIVDIVAATLLRLGFLVCTFNFRGASGSAGRTSWTAKAERADYMSVVGFVAHYVQHLDPFRQPTPEARRLEISPPSSPTQPDMQSPSPESPILLLGGYSYGAMVTTQLPALATILAPFATPAVGSPAAEIRQRATNLADTQNITLRGARAAAAADGRTQAAGASRRSLALMRVGGDEESRKSHDSHRRSHSVDRVEEQLKDLMRRRGHNRRASGNQEELPDKQDKPTEQALLPEITGMTSWRPAYLLISPLQGLITNLAAMSLSNPFARKEKDLARSPTRVASVTRKNTKGSRVDPHAAEPDLTSPESEEKLIRNPTMAIYGDKDVFVAARKLREWASRLERQPDSLFRAHEISSAGHFWTEEKVLYVMRDAVSIFAGGLLARSNGAGHAKEPPDSNKSLLER